MTNPPESENTASREAWIVDYINKQYPFYTKIAAQHAAETNSLQKHLRDSWQAAEAHARAEYAGLVGVITVLENTLRTCMRNKKGVVAAAHIDNVLKPARKALATLAKSGER